MSAVPDKPQTFGPAILVADIQKNATDTIKITVDTLQVEGKTYKYVALRVWTEKNDSKEMVPTKKGMTMPFRSLPGVIAALEKILRNAERKGYM